MNSMFKLALFTFAVSLLVANTIDAYEYNELGNELDTNNNHNYDNNYQSYEYNIKKSVDVNDEALRDLENRLNKLLEKQYNHEDKQEILLQAIRSILDDKYIYRKQKQDDMVDSKLKKLLKTKRGHFWKRSAN